jgi:hypothetical protein
MSQTNPSSERYRASDLSARFTVNGSDGPRAPLLAFNIWEGRQPEPVIPEREPTAEQLEPGVPE